MIEIIPFSSPQNAQLNLSDKDYKEIAGDLSTLPPAIKLNDYDISFDFNHGLRLQVPTGNYHVRIWDSDSQIVFFYGNVSNVLLISLEKFFIRWEFEIRLDGKIIVHHKFNPAGLTVYFNIQWGGVGDCISQFPCMEEFCRKWKCHATCSVRPDLRGIIETYFPTVECVDKAPSNTYASYQFFLKSWRLYNPKDIRKISMFRMGQEILDLCHVDKKVYYPTKPRQIIEPYVCIAAQASTTFKAWLNPTGWEVVVAYLKSLGYRVLCIDKNREQTDIDVTVKIPAGAEDFTGDIPLLERINFLAYADFFIGASSGLAWLAWATDIPVVLISGITASWFEFDTPYRVFNRLACRGCHNDDNVEWPQCLLCPYHQDTSRAYECSRTISARHVINVIDELRRRENLIHT